MLDHADLAGGRAGAGRPRRLRSGDPGRGLAVRRHRTAGRAAGSQDPGGGGRSPGQPAGALRVAGPHRPVARPLLARPAVREPAGAGRKPVHVDAGRFPRAAADAEGAFPLRRADHQLLDAVLPGTLAAAARALGGRAARPTARRHLRAARHARNPPQDQPGRGGRHRRRDRADHERSRHGAPLDRGDLADRGRAGRTRARLAGRAGRGRGHAAAQDPVRRQRDLSGQRARCRVPVAGGGPEPRHGADHAALRAALQRRHVAGAGPGHSRPLGRARRPQPAGSESAADRPFREPDAVRSGAAGRPARPLRVGFRARRHGPPARARLPRGAAGGRVGFPHRHGGGRRWRASPRRGMRRRQLPWTGRVARGHAPPARPGTRRLAVLALLRVELLRRPRGHDGRPRDDAPPLRHRARNGTGRTCRAERLRGTPGRQSVHRRRRQPGRAAPRHVARRTPRQTGGRRRPDRAALRGRQQTAGRYADRWT